MAKGAPLRICHVVLSLRPGGLENGVVNVINGLEGPDFHSSVCCLQDAGEFAARIASPSVEVVALGLQPGNDFRMPFRLAAQLRRLRPDIVHTRNIEAFFYGAVAAKLAGVPHLIHSEHGRTFPESRLRARVQRLLLRVTDASFAVSAQLRTDLIREIGVPDTMEVLYNGVDLTRFAPAALAEPRHPDVEGVLIGTVGRLVPVKNYTLLLRALATLPAQLPWTLRLVGGGPERERLHGMALELGLKDKVQFLGHREDVAAHLAQMDIFVLPSLSEGMSNTLLEAMISGAAAIASEVGGNGELVQDGVDGLLFPSDDVTALSERLTRLVADAGLRQRLATAAAERARRDFDIRGMFARYAALYERVAHRSKQ